MSIKEYFNKLNKWEKIFVSVILSILVTMILLPLLLRIPMVKNVIKFIIKPLGKYGPSYFEFLGILITAVVAVYIAIYSSTIKKMIKADRQEDKDEKINETKEEFETNLKCFSDIINNEIEGFEKSKNYLFDVAKGNYNDYIAKWTNIFKKYFGCFELDKLYDEEFFSSMKEMESQVSSYKECLKKDGSNEEAEKHLKEIQVTIFVIQDKINKIGIAV